MAVPGNVVRPVTLPAHCTTELLTNPLPVTVRRMGAEPAVMLVWDRPPVAAIEGCDSTVYELGAPVIAGGPGFTTLTNTTPPLATRLPGTTAVNCVALSKVVLSDVGPAPPFHCTTELLTKFVPVTVRIKLVELATAAVGVKVEMAGDGAELIE